MSGLDIFSYAPDDIFYNINDRQTQNDYVYLCRLGQGNFYRLSINYIGPTATLITRFIPVVTVVQGASFINTM